jgi:hypothetical protein
MLRARKVSKPHPSGAATADHSALVAILGTVAAGGISAIPDLREDLKQYLDSQSHVVPDQLGAAGALAFWINLYNAGALAAISEAQRMNVGSVLRVPGVFTEHLLTVAGEDLSLDDIEHGKIRRFRDPRIHGALVCGSVSCPTLRSTPFAAATIDIDLDDQVRFFLRNGGARFDSKKGRLTLSRVFKWYGRDFTHPAKMPTILPVSKSQLARTVSVWLEEPAASAAKFGEVRVSFSDYDWGLGCSVT